MALVSVVVPTFREVESLPHLIDRVAAVRAASGLDFELVIVDDESDDGTEELVAARPETWLRLIVRRGERGLASAVIRGLEEASGDTLVVMDADLSHPPESIPEMVRLLSSGFDFVVGSRYCEGGSTAHDWGFMRWVNSRIATWLARPFTSVADPMSGYFALRRETFLNAAELTPVGYKIGLELIVKCGCQRVREVPIHFADRGYGVSKLGVGEQLRFIQHLRRLAIHKYGTWSHLAQFLAVGAMGAVVNLAILTVLLALGVSAQVSLGIAIAGSMCFNFVLNRRFTFSYARSGSILRQFVGFVAASSVGAVLNYLSALWVLSVADIPAQVAALVGIAVGSLVNFVANRYLVFRYTHIRVDQSD